MWLHLTEVTASLVMTIYSGIVNSSSASDEGCFKDPSTGFLITPTVIVPSEDHPPYPHQAVSLQFSRWPYKGATKISLSQTCCILSVTFSFPPLTGSVCIPLSEWLLLTLSAHFDFTCHPSISNVIFSFSHLISCAHLKSPPSPRPSVFVTGRRAGAHLNSSRLTNSWVKFWMRLVWVTVLRRSFDLACVVIGFSPDAVFSCTPSTDGIKLANVAEIPYRMQRFGAILNSWNPLSHPALYPYFPPYQNSCTKDAEVAPS